MTDFIYPTSAELTQIAQTKIPRLTQDRPIFTFFPIKDQDAFLLMWEQMDNYTGLQQVRGLNGDPPRVTRVGVKRYQLQPGVYGEFIMLDEVEMTMRRSYGTFASPTDLSDMTMQAQDQLLGRRLDRIELTCWTLVITGTFSILGPSGAILHTDSFTTQTFSAGTTWATFATSTPLADLRSVALLARGYSTRFDASATAYMNQRTFNNLISNTNASDLGGRRTSGLATVNSPADVSTLLTRDNLPNIVVYDEGYLPDGGGAFIPFIPDNKVAVIGSRPGNQPVGNFMMIRNVNNQGMAPGPYQKIIDTGEYTVPRSIQVHDGLTGGPVIYFPSSIVVMSV